jgi:hypothetical protein
MRSPDHVSYHEDGKYWSTFEGKRPVKKIRQPLSTFVGTETLLKATINVFRPMPDDRDEQNVRLKKEDVVLDFVGGFWFEIILSESVPQLSELPERINARVFVKHWKPVITIEAFQLAGGGYPADRFPPSTQWVEDLNLFFNHSGKI